MRIRSSQNLQRPFTSALLWITAATLLVPATAFAQQSLINRIVTVVDAGICGSVTDVTLSNITCLGGQSAGVQEETATQLSGNSAAAAGSNASQTTIAQTDAQTSRMAGVRAQAAPTGGSGLRSGDGSGFQIDGRLGGFFNGFGAFGEAELNGEEPGFEYDGGGFTAGIDYLLNENFVVGGGFGWNRQDTDFDRFAASGGGGVGGGDLEADSFVFSVYGSWFEGPIYLDAIVSYTYVDYEMTRRFNSPSSPAGAISGGVTSETDADQAGVTFGGGYQFVYQGATFGPIVQWDYLHTEIDSFNEAGFASIALSYKDQQIDSMIMSLGGEIVYPISTEFGVISPHFRMTWENQLLDDPRKIKAQFILDDSGGGNTITTVTDDPDRQYGRIGTGVAAQLKDGISCFVEYETVIGLRDVEAHKFTAGGRYEF